MSMARKANDIIARAINCLHNPLSTESTAISHKKIVLTAALAFALTSILDTSKANARELMDRNYIQDRVGICYMAVGYPNLTSFRVTSVPCTQALEEKIRQNLKDNNDIKDINIYISKCSQYTRDSMDICYLESSNKSIRDYLITSIPCTEDVVKQINFQANFLK